MKWYWAILTAVVMVLYLIIGGVIFHFLEGPNEDSVRDKLNAILVSQVIIRNDTCVSEQELRNITKIVQGAAIRGIYAYDHNDAKNWDIFHAVLFCVTVVTTIGYGRARPLTENGRFFCIFYTVFGIPVMLLLLAYMGNKIYKVNCWLADKINICPNKKLDEISDMLVIALMGLVFMVLIPSALFHVVEDWPYLDSIYFVIMTLSTVGFGDLVPDGGSYHHVTKHVYEVLAAFWTLFGLAWFAGVINSIQRYLERSVDTEEEVSEAGSDLVSLESEEDADSNSTIWGLEGRFERKSIFHTEGLITDVGTPEPETVCEHL